MSEGPHRLKTIVGKGKTYEIVTQGKVRGVIEKVQTNWKARQFADLLLSDKEVAGLFFHHWRQLTVVPGISVPIVADTNRPLNGPDPLTREGSEAAGRSGVAFESIFRAAEPLLTSRVMEILERMKADGINSETLNQEAFGLFLFKSLGIFSGASPLGAVVGLIRPFEDYFADEMGDFAFELLSAVKSGIRAAGDGRTNQIISDSSLDATSYRKVVRRMQDDGYLRTGLAIQWCEGHPQFPVSLVTVGDSHQTRTICQVCNQELVFCAFLLPTFASMVWVRQYAGILQYLLPWTLEQSKVPWATNVYLRGVAGDKEKDIIFEGAKGVSIVECKSDYTDTPNRTVNVKLRDGVSQLAGAVKSYQDLGIELDKAILATNNEANEERIESVKRWVEQESDLSSLRSVTVKLVGPANLSGWWR